MTIIDGKKCLNNSVMQTFLKDEDKNNIVQFYIADYNFLFECKVDNLRSAFENEEIENVIQSDDVVISLILDEKILQILGIDYRWWIAPYRRKKYSRLNQLFNDEIKIISKQEKETTKKSNTVTCAIANVENDVVSNIREYEDTIKNLIPILNKEYTKNVLQTRFKPTLKFCFNYKTEDKSIDLDNASYYKSFEELINEGVFEI